MTDTTQAPVYNLPDQRYDVVVLSLLRAFETLRHSWPVVIPDTSTLASEQCAMYENGQIPIPNGQPLTNNTRLFRDIFCESYMVGYKLGCQMFHDGLYLIMMQYPEEKRGAILHGVAMGIATPFHLSYKPGSHA